MINGINPNNVTTKINNNKKLAMNPLYSQGCVTYIKSTWLPKVSLWSNSIVYFLKRIHGMKIEGNNQSSEIFNWNFKKNTQVSYHTHDLGSYILFCDDFDRENNKFFVHQTQMIRSIVNRYQTNVSKKVKY